MDFLRRGRAIYAAAAEHGLPPYRLYFEGTVADSGGGGQITLGGPTPKASPFLREPRLLPRLVHFLNRHPTPPCPISTPMTMWAAAGNRCGRTSGERTHSTSWA